MNVEKYLTEDYKKDYMYWVDLLNDIESYIKHYKISSVNLLSEEILLPKQTLLKITEFAKIHKITNFKFVSIFSVYLSRIDRNNGCILKTRFHDEINDSDFNTLLKIDYDKKKSFDDYTQQVSKIYDDAISHTKTNIEEYVENIVNLVSYSIIDLTDNGILFKDNDSVLTLNVYEDKIELLYNSSLFSSVYISRMLNNLLAMIDNVLKSSDQFLKDINILSNREKKLIKEFSQGEIVDFDDDYTLAKAFRDNALKNPNKIAVNDGVNQITYGDLEKSSNSIANDLKSKYNIGGNVPVCLMLPRTYHFAELVLALNKIGAYNIPIDSNYPVKRINHMVNLCQSKHVVVDKHYEFLDDLDIEVIYLDELSRDFDVDIEIKSQGDDLFSILFTSGTTGLPKGVTLYNKQIINWNAFLKQFYSSNEGVMGIYRDFTFIGSCWMFAAFYQNLTCRIFNEREKNDISLLVDEFKDGNISLIDIPDSICEPIFENDDIKLKYLLTGGSKINKLPINDYTKVIILYGTTETNMTSSHQLNLSESHETIPIGRPTPNKWIYILDEESNTVPIGVPGEICVSGDYISQGYHNYSELTSNVFVSNPLSYCEENNTLYHTGDIGFFNFNGELEIMRRMDDQLSVRGFRVESDEILNIMKKFNGFSEIILNVVDDILIAYYSLNADVNIEKVKEEIKQELPSYMIPSIFIELDSIPLNANGKVDKSQLPKQSILTKNVSPENDLEEELLKMCQEILANDDFGITDNLLSLGFSSLSFMKLNYEIHSKFGINLKIIDLMECTNVREVSNILDNDDSLLFEKYEKRELYPLTNNQTIICQSRANNPNVFKLYFTVKIEDVDIDKLKDSFIKAINNHPFLKSSIIKENDVFYIKRDDDADISNLIQIYNLSKSDFDLFEKHVFEADTNFYDKFFQDVTSKYVDKFFYCVMVENKNNVIVRLLFDHIAFDHYSISLLFNEIDKIYFNLEDEIDEEVIDGFDYNMFIVNDEQESVEFFNKVKDDVMAYGDLFIPPIYEYGTDCCETDELNFKVSKENIQNFSNKNNISLSHFFMVTFALTLHKYSNLNRGILPVVSNGRFFNELMNTHHYIAKTIYLKFEIDKYECLNDVFINIYDEMKRIIEMEPNSLIFVYGNQWLFNFIESNNALNFNITELNHDENKPRFVKNVGKNFINDVYVIEMDNFYNLSLKYHNKRYNKEYISSFLDCWVDIIKYIVSYDDLDMGLSFLDDIYENLIAGEDNE